MRRAAGGRQAGGGRAVGDSGAVAATIFDTGMLAGGMAKDYEVPHGCVLPKWKYYTHNMDPIFTTLLILVLGYEAVAIVNKRLRDTISERNWDARDYSWWSRLLVDEVVIWGFWHLLIDVEFFVQGISWVDLVVLAVSAAFSLWTWRRKAGVNEV